MKVVFSKYLLFFLICFCSVLGVKAQSYKSVLADFDKETGASDQSNREKVALKLKEKFFKDLAKDPVKLAEVENCIGNYYFKNNQLDSSYKCFNRAVNGIYAVKADTSFDYAFYLANASFVLAQMGYYQMADQYYAVALPRLAKFLGSSSPEYSAYLKQYVGVKIDMADWQTASAYNDALLFYYKGTYGDKHEMYLACLTNKAMILQGQGKYNEAIYVFADLVEVTQQTMPNDTLTQAITLNNLAYCYRLLGNNSEAEKLFLKAYELESKCSSVPKSDFASLLNNLGIVYKAKCDYVNAEKCFLKSIELYKAAGMINTAEITNPCNNLGDMYRLQGNLRMANQYLSYAIDIRRMTSGEESETYANAMFNLCLLLCDFDEYNQALPYVIKASEIYKKVGGEKSFNYANSLALLSSIYQYNKDHAKALEYINTALIIMGNAVGKNHEYYARYLMKKAEIELELKNYKSAISISQDAVSLFRKNYGENNFNYAEAVASMAVVSFVAGDFAQARTGFLKSIYSFEKIFKENMAVMSDDEKIVFFSKNNACFGQFEAFAVKEVEKNKDIKDDSLLIALLNERLWTKSILLNESGKMQKMFQQQSDTGIVNLYAKWLVQKKYIQEVYQLSVKEREQNEIDLDYENTYLSKIEKKLFQNSKDLINTTNTLTFETLKRKLGKTERAVEIISTGLYVNDSTSRDVYAAIVIGADFKVPKVIVLDSSDCFDSLFIERYKFNIHSNKTDLLSYNRYFKPLEKYLNGITKIYFSPDGVYQQMNIYTLYDPIAKKYLIDKMEVEQVTSLNDLQKEVTPASNNLTAVLFGYPDYEWKKEVFVNSTSKVDENLIASRFGFSELPELPGTKKETEEIFSVFNTNKWDAKLYLAKQATEEQVKNTVSPTILHIATHGFFLPNLDYSDEKILGFETESAKANPLLRSGVIMAGAASKDTTIEKKEDGILTAYEASLLNLQNTELVTLSACETGLGDQVMNGQGVYGLQRAFLTAGAKSVLMSLWVVDDNATKELMTNFYGEWIKNYSSTNKRSSFRKAQLEVKKRYPSPYYWGAFVMIGK